MKRPYTRDRYLEIVGLLRAAQPALAFSTDVIVGFPGETDADFEETRALCRTVDYDMAYIFKYSVRTGTPAASMPGQVPEGVREERNRVLLDDLREGSLRRSQALVGTIQEVLVEGNDKTGLLFSGRTRGNRTTVFDAAPRLVGSLVPVEITRATVSTLYGNLAIEGSGLQSPAGAASL
jgi:tRNA-2-methylthio-N6-dimethylallyladenosine synthase